MFRIHDYELTEVELALFQTTAQVDKRDSYITFPGQSRRNERGTFNLAEILVEWFTVEEFGIQRIRLGVAKPLTKSRWARKLHGRTKKRPQSLHAACVWSRKISVRACFPSEAVRFRVLGWRLLNVEYWTPGSAVKIAEAKEARITQAVLVPCSDKSTSLPGVKPR
jgi:hypothetical protein